MILKIFIITLLLITVQANAQLTGISPNARISISKPEDRAPLNDPENSIGIVFYDFSYVSDTMEPKHPKSELMSLAFSKDYGKFYSESYRISDSTIMDAILQQIQQSPSTAKISFGSGMQLAGSKEVFLSDAKTEMLAERLAFIDKSYLIKDKNSLIDWTIEDSTKMIGSYTCQKAVGTSHGRHYTAWFTTDLPYSFGPRRLWGLPGLILEAYDDSKRIFYHFKSVNLAKHIPLGIPENAIYSTRKEYDEMQSAFSRDPMAFFKANMPASMAGAKVASVSSTFVGSSSKTSVVDFSPKKDKKTKKEEETKEEDNFPIDLTQD